ncbi:MAG: DUF1848 domain-containing protein [Acetobacter sp.]|nr:DUF1848 domain-containing protein [Acetobacter sp.]
MIVSASRRTDIPAFYAEWFMNRVREQFLLIQNPRNTHQIKRVSLIPHDVEAIVFWTKNPKNLIPYLPQLDALGYAFYFQYTVTGYPRCLERSVPRPQMAIEIFHQLSDLIGAERVIWRYDPILLSNKVNFAEHKRLFEKIARFLEGKTHRVMMSFADFYAKTERNLKTVDGLAYQDITLNTAEQEELLSFMVAVAHRHGMVIQTCSEKQDFSHLGIPHGKCIDDNLLTSVFGLTTRARKDKNQRDQCGCVKSVDIGVYNTCLHGCAYCYATQNPQQAARHKEQHDPNSPFLLGPPLSQEEIQTLQKSQTTSPCLSPSLFDAL